MKQEFLNFLTKLMETNEDLVKELMTDNIQTYIDALYNGEEEKPKVDLTDNGKLILEYLQTTEKKAQKAREIAEGLFISSRSVSGSMRKLVSDGYVERIGDSPAIYTITEKGKNYKIGENE